MTDDAILSIASAAAAGVLTVRVSGELDITGEPEVLAAVRDALERWEVTRIVIDLTAVDFIDSSGLRALLVCRDEAAALGLPLTLAVGEGTVTRLLKATGVDGWFIYE